MHGNQRLRQSAGRYTPHSNRWYLKKEALLLLWLKRVNFSSADPSESFSETSAEYANNLEPEKIMKDLNFTDDTYTQSKLILLASGGSLRLGCSVTGYPFPDLLWFKVG